MPGSLVRSRWTARRKRLAAVLAGAFALSALAALPVATPARAATTAVTVDAPQAAGDPNVPATVTVSQTQDLVYQTVQVSWTGFRPSAVAGDTATPGPVQSNQTPYPVIVLQCAANPKVPSDCYTGKDTDLLPPTQTPDDTANEREAKTLADGTPGSPIDFEVRTAREMPKLSCSVKVACSIVVVPNYGDPTQPDLDFILGTDGFILYSWAWARRVVIPISFAPSADSCPLKDADVSVAGSFMASRAVQSWQAKLCTQAGEPLQVTYSALGEPIARGAFLAGNLSTDVGLTTLPPDKDALAARKYTFAPVGVSSVVVAFVDDRTDNDPVLGPSPGLQVRDMVLNPRLVAKLLTASYNWISSPITQEQRKTCIQLPIFVSGSDQAPPFCPDDGVLGNPSSLFSDPEFTALNPLPNGAIWGDRAQPPLIMLDNSDMIYELTRWIASDPDARAFLNGQPDPYGMTVNPYYKGVTYPVDRFELQDPYPRLAATYQPVVGLDAVVRNIIKSQPSGRDVNSALTAPGLPLAALPPQDVGSRSLLAFLDSSNAANLDLPVARLVNAAGAAVGPTTRAMTAAVADMTVGADGITRSMNFKAKDPDAYPLTMVQYAMAPTSGLPPARAAKVAEFLRYAGGAGQLYGTGAGNLPAGYLSLPDDLRAQTLTAADKVAAQVDNPPPPPPTTPATTTTTSAPARTTSTSAPAGGPVPVTTSPTPTPTTSPSSTPTATAAALPQSTFVASQTPGWVGYGLPLLLGIGLLTVVVGPLLLVRGSRGAGR